jgi:hypothetical protein
MAELLLVTLGLRAVRGTAAEGVRAVEGHFVAVLLRLLAGVGAAIRLEQAEIGLVGAPVLHRRRPASAPGAHRNDTGTTPRLAQQSATDRARPPPSATVRNLSRGFRPRAPASIGRGPRVDAAPLPKIFPFFPPLSWHHEG